MEANTKWAGILILIGMAMYSTSGTAQVHLPEDAKKVNPYQERLDELLSEPNYPPRLREAIEKGYVAYLRSTPGEDVSKYDRGERMTDAEFRSVRQRIAHMYQVEGDAVGRLALGESGRFFLQPFLTSANMYEVVRHSSTQLDVVYIEGLSIQPVASIRIGGTISRSDGVIKDWSLPQFPVQWPFLDDQQCPIFPAPEMFKEGDLVVAKDTVAAPPVPADALGWAYPLACVGMLGADSKIPPPAGDLLWIRPRAEGGLTIEYTGPNKTGVYAWVDDGLRVHWTMLPQESGTYWSRLGVDSEGTIHKFYPLGNGGICYIGWPTFDTPVCAGSYADEGGRHTINDILEMRTARMSDTRKGEIEDAVRSEDNSGVSTGRAPQHGPEKVEKKSLADSAVRVIVSENTGVTGTVNSITLTGKNADQFQIVQGGELKPLAAWEERQILVAHAPTTTGYHTAQLVVTLTDAVHGVRTLTSSFTGYGIKRDTDGDGMSDEDETRDLLPNTLSIDNPFNLDVEDSTGDYGATIKDGLPDGQNDFDGDNMTNEDEFFFGYNPLDSSSVGYCTEWDKDGDEIPDEDENCYCPPLDTYHGDRSGDDGSTDPDGISDGSNDFDCDGFSNAVEALWGSNPMDPNSIPPKPAPATG
jgi:hypothetical protein